MRISSEEDAWRYLERYLETGDATRPLFENWPTMSIIIRGEDYLGSITASQMDAFLEFQKTLNRAYAAISRGHFDGRYLSDEEEEELVLRTEVREGSSIFETDLSPFVKALSMVVSTASPTEVIVAAVLIPLVLTSPIVVKSFFEGRARELELKNQRALIDALASRNAEETEQGKTYQKVLRKLSRKFPALEGMVPQLRRAQLTLLTSLQDADTAQINGVTISRDEILDLSQRRPKKSRRPHDLREEMVITSMQKKENIYSLGLASEHKAVIAKLYADQFSAFKIGRLIHAFQHSTAVNFVVRITRTDQSTLKGVVHDFTVPQRGRQLTRPKE
ncbi:hypothetical protein SAMN05216345_10722 [Cupriavidus sp. YR651]|uniref:hypothetical protein n=1 Tax=Cupriavidus sp. YR651 TaxID=1855315 RepID=UPI0008826A73|nr:hypothetical protein [Cupriavidus sp. YR651]SDD22376.1 hypothetical protein SAMN05216345_10722 [Cupriavidus sp. YR651]